MYKPFDLTYTMLPTLLFAGSSSLPLPAPRIVQSSYFPTTGRVATPCFRLADLVRMYLCVCVSVPVCLYVCVCVCPCVSHTITHKNSCT